MNIREVAPTDTVRVTVYRRYGETPECADYWDAEIKHVRPNGELAQIGIEQEANRYEPAGIRWLDVRGMNPDGNDPAYTDTRLMVRKNVTGAKFERVTL